jgi:hypothetical protein
MDEQVVPQTAPTSQPLAAPGTTIPRPGARPADDFFIGDGPEEGEQPETVFLPSHPLAPEGEEVPLASRLQHPSTQQIPVPDRFGNPFAATSSRPEQMPPTSSSIGPEEAQETLALPDETYQEIGGAVGELFLEWAEGTEKLMRESILPALKTIVESGKDGVLHIGGKVLQVSYDVAAFILTDPYVLLGAALFTLGGGAYDKVGNILDSVQLKAQNNFWGMFGYKPTLQIEVLDDWQRLVWHANNALTGAAAGGMMAAIMRPFVNIQKHLAEGARARYMIPGPDGLMRIAEGGEELLQGRMVSEGLMKEVIQLIAKSRRPRAVAKRYVVPAHYPPVPAHYQSAPAITYGDPLAIRDMTKTEKVHATRIQRLKQAEEDRKAKALELAQRKRRFFVGEGMGRGRIHVPDPVLPHNDVSNDPYLIKSKHNSIVE